MRKVIERPDVEQGFRYLKDFQRLTVDRVFQRLYLDERPTRRFLVADEVGLGKTLVARGVITRTIDHLWDRMNRIDIIYMCSNSDIARQNVARLTPRGLTDVSESARITLLPITAHGLESRKVNVIALTPGTSLQVGRNLGLKRERALLLHMLEDHWGLDHVGACRLFAGTAGLLGFKGEVRTFGDDHEIDRVLQGAFLKELDDQVTKQVGQGRPTLRERLNALVTEFRIDRGRTDDEWKEQRAVIGELRQMLGRSCIRSLQPDLIILDEFQRFKSLLSDSDPDPAAEMARQLFEYEDESAQARVLLLSATPYKMFTTPDEANGESHYDDFLRTAQFLLHDEPDKASVLAQALKDYRAELFRAAHEGFDRLAELRDQLETILRSVMVRTERLAVTPDRSGMLSERPIQGLAIEPRDIVSYVEGQKLARLAGSPETLEYWKAAPWLLNFMEGYKLSVDLQERVEDHPSDPALRRLIESSPNALLDLDDLIAFRRLDPAHARLRWLLRHVLDGGLWQLLWLPPTLSYYQLAPGVAAIAATSPSKTLVFSAWKVVPRVIASVLSQEAERLRYERSEGQGSELSDVTTRLEGHLRVRRSEGSVAGLSVLTLTYPSVWLAGHCDPKKIGAELARTRGGVVSLAEVLDEAERRILPLLERVTAKTPDRTAPDESWYWAAPILIDLAEGDQATRRWLAGSVAEYWSGGGKRARAEAHRNQDEEEEGQSDAPRDDHPALLDLVTRVRELVAGNLPGGTPPRDLLQALALMAIGGPATAALRSLGRVASGAQLDDAALRSAAARIGAGFQSLFNQPDATAAVRALAEPADYWKQCLEYAAGAGLQSTLDEYTHLLMSEAGLHGRDAATLASTMADRISPVVGMQHARVGAYQFHVKRGKVHRDTKQLRSRFAMRFGEERANETGEKVRADVVRDAFNSPFAPFVLATTSVGQEGLDFHFYCHSVVHWNLPPNPVDLEQREGRVHRFKGLAVRKNVARAHAAAWQAQSEGDPWEATFDAALDARASSENDLVPYWVYPIEGGAAIERHVPNYPLSREVERFRALRESLAVYRMVFGQPRQEELMAYLVRTVAPERIAELAERLQISLAPNGSAGRAAHPPAASGGQTTLGSLARTTPPSVRR